RLDSAVEALGEPGELLDGCHRDAGGGDPRGRGAGGDDRYAEVAQPAGQLLQPGLVIHADQGPADGYSIGGHGDAPRTLRDGDLAPADRPAVPDQPAHILDQLTALRGLDPLGEPLHGVAVLDRYGHLSNDRPGVDAVVDEEQG